MSAFRLLAAVVVAAGVTACLRADPPYIAPPGAPATGQIVPPVMPASGTCPTCGGAGTPGKTCQTCGGSWFQKKQDKPFVVNLCPGACFGYFQTQWRKWDDVCPYPYQGIGVSDAPRPPTPPLPPIKVATPLPTPKPVEPKSDGKPMSGLPTIPGSNGNY